MKKILIFMLTFAIAISSVIGVVFASELPDGLLLKPNDDNDGGYFVYLSEGRYYCITVKDVDSFTLTKSAGYYWSSSKTNSMCYLYNDGQWQYRYTINSSGCSVGQINEMVYNSFDIKNANGDILYYKVVDPDIPDSSEPTIPDETEPTEPSSPEHGGGGMEFPDDDSDSGLVDRILNGIKNFFTTLLSPIINYFENRDENGLLDRIFNFFTNLFSPIITFIESFERVNEFERPLSELLGSLKDYTITPIQEYINGLMNLNTIAFLGSLWEIPVVKDIFYAAIVCMVFGAVITFLGGGFA